MNLYLNFDGNCREAFEFYRSIFGGEFDAIQTFGEAPGDAGMPAEMSDRIMHVSLPMGDSSLMGSDTPNAAELVAGNNFSIALAPTDRAETDALFARLSDGGDVTMALEETFWGAYFGSCRDRFGINWMLNCELG
jgi:PhnB protein